MEFSDFKNGFAQSSDLVDFINHLRAKEGLRPLVHCQVLRTLVSRQWGIQDFYLNLKTHRTEKCVLNLTWHQCAAFIVEHYPPAVDLLASVSLAEEPKGLPLTLENPLTEVVEDLKEEVRRLKQQAPQKAPQKAQDSEELARLQSFEKHMAKHLPEINATHEARIVELKARHLEQLAALKDQLASKSKQIAQLVCGLSPT